MMTHITRGALIQFEYTNHRGETRTRKVEYHFASFGSNTYHPEPTTFFTGFCLDKRQLRSFDTSRIKNMRSLEA